MVEIDAMMSAWVEAGMTQDQIDKFVKAYYDLEAKKEKVEKAKTEEEASKQEPSEKPDETPADDKQEPSEKPDETPADETPPPKPSDSIDKDENPSEEESEPPVPPEPEPEDPDNRSYNPERNVDEEGGGTGTDPPCKPIFDPSVARMKRGETYDKWVPGGADGYESLITHNHRKLEPIALEKDPNTSSDLRKFRGKADLIVSPGTPTALFMPTIEHYVTDYIASDNSDLEFFHDGLDNVYVQAMSTSSRRPIRLEYTVWCKWEHKVNHLEYYYQDYDDKWTLLDAYNSGIKIGYGFNETVATVFRRNVPTILDKINANYFKDLVKILKRMPSPGYIVDEKADISKKYLAILQKYNFKRTIEILAGYMMSFGCADIPEDGDMVIDCVESREGACRHRALAFHICGSVIGIPVRYCCSDCHAYPEIYFGNVDRWVGMDLGGCPPPQPKGPPPKPKEQQDILQAFRERMKMAGWEETDDQFIKAVRAAEQYLQLTGGP